MAKRRGRTISLDGLVARLSALDKQRVAIQERIVSAIRGLGVPSPFSSFSSSSLNPRRGRGTAGAKKTRKRRRMSAEARARIAAAQKRRWAKVRAEKK